MTCNTVTNIVDFSQSIDERTAHKGKVNVDVSFTRKTGLNEITNKAMILDGTFSLKDRVKTLEDHKIALERAVSTKGRITRSAIALLVVGCVTAGIAVMVFGGPIGLLFGSFATLGVMGVSEMALFELIFDYQIPVANILCPITMPIFLAYYLLTCESKKAKNVKNSEIETAEIADYVINKKELINSWLQERHQETSIQITQEKAKLNSEQSIEGLKLITAEVKRLEKQLNKINHLTADLKTSYEIAQTIANSV